MRTLVEDFANILKIESMNFYGWNFENGEMENVARTLKRAGNVGRILGRRARRW